MQLAEMHAAEIVLATSVQGPLRGEGWEANTHVVEAAENPFDGMLAQKCRPSLCQKAIICRSFWAGLIARSWAVTHTLERRDNPTWSLLFRSASIPGCAT